MHQGEFLPVENDALVGFTRSKKLTNMLDDLQESALSGVDAGRGLIDPCNQWLIGMSSMCGKVDVAE